MPEDRTTVEERRQAVLDLVNAAEADDLDRFAAAVARVLAISNPRYAAFEPLAAAALARVLRRLAGGGGLLQRLLGRVFG